MLKKVLVATLVVLVVAGAGLFFWARAVLTGDRVAAEIAAQLGKAIGQPVSIAGVGVSIFPRIAMNLQDVAIGQPARITVKSLHVGTDFRALLSRRIEHADVKLSGALVQLPLPAFTFGSAAPDAPAAGAAPSRPAVELVSVDEISLADAEIVSGGRHVKGDVLLSLAGGGLTVTRVTLTAEKTHVTLTGRITDLAGPAGELAIATDNLSVLDLAAFASDFSGGATRAAPAGAPTRPPAASPTTASASSAMHLTLTIKAGHATFGTLALDALDGTARVTSQAITIEPISFGVFGGQYRGSMTLTPGDLPQFGLHAALTGVDTGAAMAFAGSPGALTGRLTGRVDLSGKGADAESLMRTLRGSARVDIVDGTVKGLGLVKGVVLAGSMRKDSMSELASTSATEPFSKFGTTLVVADGAATTTDLRFESKDLLLTATGAFKLDGSVVNLAGPVQLSDELSRQAGRDLVRFTQKDGRVTIPATVTGQAGALHVGVDAGDLAKRAITNAAADEARTALLKKLGIIK